MQHIIRNIYLFEINPFPSLMYFINIINQSMPTLRERKVQKFDKKLLKKVIKKSLSCCHELSGLGPNHFSAFFISITIKGPIFHYISYKSLETIERHLYPKWNKYKMFAYCSFFNWCMGKPNQKASYMWAKQFNYINNPKGPKHKIQMRISPVTIQMCSPGKI